ncbi:hypothetical protein [Photobacterium leiognathi]|uniref:hypothetical protein n=1 Tax=Photobacterium leiognathi TaxID=553611 RepID=UPI002981FCB6|nr:hypothetical protein [Photobacterium leiognathi]
MSTTINAKVIQDVGWDTYSPIPKVAEDTQIDDDSSGKSTSGGLIIVKPDASKLNNTNKEIDCDSDRFKKLCNDLGVDIAAAERNAKAYSNYMVSDLSQNLNGKIQSARAEARNYSNQVKNQAFARTDKAKSDANSYADFLHTNSVAYTNDKYDQAINHANWANRDARAYADERASWARNDARTYANNRANEAQRNANSYTNGKHNEAIAHGSWANRDAENYAYSLFTDLKNQQSDSDIGNRLVTKIVSLSIDKEYTGRHRWHQTRAYSKYPMRKGDFNCNGKYLGYTKTTATPDYYDDWEDSESERYWVWTKHVLTCVKFKDTLR